MEWPRICFSRLLDQNFGIPLIPQDVILPYYNTNGTNYFRPWTVCTAEGTKKDVGSNIENNKNKLIITLDVQHFKPNEINVKMSDKEITVEGKHEERQDDHGFISRQFVRRYSLPSNCIPESISSTLSSDGVLIITANKNIAETSRESEKTVPIKVCGPCLQEGEAKTAMKCLVETKSNDKKELQLDKSEIDEQTKATKNSLESDVSANEMKSKETKKGFGSDMTGTEMKSQDTKKSLESDMTAFEMISKETKQVVELDMTATDIKSKKGLALKSGSEAVSKDTKKEIELDRTANHPLKDFELEKKESQIILMEDHCRLLKPELLQEAVLTTEQLLSESRKETDELLKLITSSKTQSSTAASDKLEEALGQCKTAIAELTDKFSESSMSASESSSVQSTRISEAFEESSSSTITSSTSSSSSKKATSETSSEMLSETFTEVISAQLKEAAENIN